MIRPRTLTWTALLIGATVHAQSNGDYRSAQSGDWSSASTWQRFNGSSFVAAPAPPTAADGQAVILAGHTVTAGTPVSIDQLVVAAGGTLATTGGTFTVVDGPGNDLSVNGTWQLSGATIAGPGAIIIANNGTLTWTSGALGASSILNINAGCTVTFNGGTVTRNALGTINNSGTWNMESGNMGQAGAGSGFPCAFNNLPGGVVNLNGWASNTNSWHQVTTNQGTFNKNNGTATFTFSNDFLESPKSFTNQAGGVVNVASGELAFACPTSNAGLMSTQAGGVALVNTSAAGTFTNAIGGSLQGSFRQNGGDLVLEGPVSINQFLFEGGSIAGPAALTIPTGETFTWTGGGFTGTAVLNLQNGVVSTVSGSGTRTALGTINNSGTWNMEGGNLGQPGFAGGPCTFNNLANGVVNLNGWESNTNTWHQVTNNQGVINKNNGTVPFSFSNDFSGKAFNNLSGGTLNVASGECAFRVPATNNGSIIGGTGSQVTLDGNATGGFFTNAAGGTVATAFQLVSGNLNVEAAFTLSSFTLLAAGVLNGPQALTIGAGGTANLNGGVLTSGATLNIAAGATANHNSAGTLSVPGTINNAGVWNMEGGNIGQPGFASGPFAFNNLAGGVVNLNGWASNTNTWHMVTSNAGTFNKNNGSTPFTFSDDFSGKSFTNQSNGSVNVNTGTLNFNVPMPLQNGTFNVASGSTMSASVAVNFAGPAIVNNGTITGTVLRFQGTSVQQLEGTGSVANLAIDNATGVDLGGDQTVTNGLTLTNGQLRLGDNDLFVENNAAGAVAGGNVNSWVVNNGTGSLHRQVIGSSYIFPVGTTSYTPLTMSTTGLQDRFSVRVQDGVSTNYGAPGVATGASITARAVDRTWVVTEQVNGGNTADITMQWNASDELPQFNRSLCAVGLYDGTDWVTGTYAAALGGGPFTRSITGVTGFREYSVSDNLLNLNTAVENLAASSSFAPRLFPQPADHALHVVAPEGRMIRTVRLYDASGRLARATSEASDRAVLDVSALPPGAYVIEWTDDRQNIGRAPVIVAR
jgi:hypothetical protein